MLAPHFETILLSLGIQMFSKIVHLLDWKLRKPRQMLPGALKWMVNRPDSFTCSDWVGDVGTAL
jgi:hypothetical protein